MTGRSPHEYLPAFNASLFLSANEADVQKAIDSNAPTEQIKAALEKQRAAHKDKEAKLAEAQENLRKVLTIRQEAQAALLGLVN